MLSNFYGKEPKIAENVFIAPNSLIIGDCEIKKGASIWFGTIIRADMDRIVIGEMTNIQDLSLIHCDEGKPTIIGNRITVGHRSILHGCLIEDECMIGMGSILLNRAMIGKNSIVAAGSLIREDFIVPPKTLVAGVPAEIKRWVSEEEIEWIRKVAEYYFQIAKRYQEAGIPFIARKDAV